MIGTREPSFFDDRCTILATSPNLFEYLNVSISIYLLLKLVLLMDNIGKCMKSSRSNKVISRVLYAHGVVPTRQFVLLI